MTLPSGEKDQIVTKEEGLGDLCVCVPLIFSTPWNRLNADLINAARQMSDPGDGSAVRGAAPAVGPDQSGEGRLIRISGSCLPVWSFSPAPRIKDVFIAVGKWSFVNWKRTWPIALFLDLKEAAAADSQMEARWMKDQTPLVLSPGFSGAGPQTFACTGITWESC